MDRETSPADGGSLESDGQYFRRAQALMARRAELFSTAPALTVIRAAAPDSASPDRPKRTRRTGGWQLSLPIAPERGRRRARMLG